LIRQHIALAPLRAARVDLGDTAGSPIFDVRYPVVS
jgi:hypothetical protein